MQYNPLEFGKETIFIYCVVVIIMIYIFSHISIGLNIIFATCISFMMIYYFHDNKEKLQSDEKQILNNMELSILPKIETKKEDVIKHIFTIQELYEYNPQSYREMIEYINAFFILYKKTHHSPETAGLNYTIMIEHKRNALNMLHSIVYNLPVQYNNKLNTAIYELDELFIKYLKDIEKIHKNNIYTKSYNTKTILLNTSDVLPANEFDDLISVYN